MPLKLGMLGMWHVHAPGIVRQVAAHPDEFTLAGFHDPDPQVASRRQQEWASLVPGLRLFPSAEDLLNEPLDGVVVEGQVFDNLRLARLALDADKPVLMEKPAGTDLAGFRALIDRAREKRLRVQMLYLFRYMSAVRCLFQLFREGAFGHIYAFRGRLPKDLADYDHNAEELRPYAGGMFFEMAGHLVDFAVTLLGPPREVTPFLGHHHDRGPGSFIDNAVAVLGWERAWGVLEVPALEVAPGARRIEVYGTEGAFVIPHLGSGHLRNDQVQPVEVYRKGWQEWQREEPFAATLQIADLREFAACITGRKEPEFSFEHDLAVQETLLRASGMFGGM
jgi:predicted dehydrogenase